MKLISNTKIILLSFISAIAFMGCGGGGSSNSSTTNSPALSGVFVDAKVKGLRYETQTLNGITDGDGVFKYKSGETIEFFLGNLSLGSAKAKSLMTPYTMSGDTDLQNPSAKTLNIAMLLQNCDSNRSDTSRLDVSNLKEYSFSNIDLSALNSTIESEITTLLANLYFQTLVDFNNTLIDTQKAKEHLTGNVEKLECSIIRINDDSGFVDTYPADISWSGSSATVQDIARVFNYARAQDSSITQELVMPSQAIWDGMSLQERGLYILNNERYYRGIKPYEGISNNVSAISQAYANVLYTTGTFGHNEDGSPWERLDRDALIKNNKDFFSYGENLYAHGSSSAYVKNPIARALYGFIYDDNVATGGSYGHRKFCLATGLNDNSLADGKEGLVGFALAKGTAYGLYPNYFSTIVVMNAFDPSSSWNHDTTIEVPFCSVAPETPSNSSPRFNVDDTLGIVVDSNTSFTWENMSLGHSERADAIDRCNNLSHGGFRDWRLPNISESKIFHRDMNSSGLVPNQRFAHCTAEVVSDGYVRTKKGAQRYTGNPGDSINFSGGANVRCVRN